jgi:hypothetical protein
MEVALTPLMKKIISDKTASKQLREALTDSSKDVEIDGKRFTLDYVQRSV